MARDLGRPPVPGSGYSPKGGAAEASPAKPSIPNAFSAINREESLFLDTDGFVHPITNWLGSDGEECAPDDAICAVAGSEGRWFSLILSEYEMRASQ